MSTLDFPPRGGNPEGTTTSIGINSVGITMRDASDNTYAGDSMSDPVNIGFGVFKVLDGADDQVAIVSAAAWREREMLFGVISYNQLPGRTEPRLRWEGDIGGGAPNGYGVMTLRDGRRVFGLFKNNNPYGPTVLLHPNGVRVEGHYDEGSPVGDLVRWSIDGELLAAQ